MLQSIKKLNWERILEGICIWVDKKQALLMEETGVITKNLGRTNFFFELYRSYCIHGLSPRFHQGFVQGKIHRNSNLIISLWIGVNNMP